MMRWTTMQRMNLLKMKIKRKRMAAFLSGLRNGLSENKYLRKLRGLRSDSRCSMTDDTKIAIEACCQSTSGFGPRSVRPIGSVQWSNMDRTDRSVQALFGSVGNRFGPSSISCRSGPTPSQRSEEHTSELQSHS